MVEEDIRGRKHMTSIVQDQWYVAAYGREGGRELFSRTICGEAILFWRTEAGVVTAMSDPCVHHRGPLRAPPVPALPGAQPPGRGHRRLRVPRFHLRVRRRLCRRPRPDAGASN